MGKIDVAAMIEAVRAQLEAQGMEQKRVEGGGIERTASDPLGQR